MVKNTSLVVTALLAVTVGYSGTTSATPDYTEMSSIPLDGRYLSRYFETAKSIFGHKKSAAATGDEVSAPRGGLTSYHLFDLTGLTGDVPPVILEVTETEVSTLGSDDSEWCPPEEPPGEAVPEPSVLSLVGLGLVALALVRLRKTG